MVVYFKSCGDYILSAKTLQDKIIKIDQVISALEDAAILGAVNEVRSEYKLNDGQTIIQQTFRGTAGIATAINNFEAIKQRYKNQLEGRTVRLMDSKNFPNYGSY
jgi:hypothetical protein